MKELARAMITVVNEISQAWPRRDFKAAYEFSQSNLPRTRSYIVSPGEARFLRILG